MPMFVTILLNFREMLATHLLTHFLTHSL